MVFVELILPHKQLVDVWPDRSWLLRLVGLNMALHAVTLSVRTYIVTAKKRIRKHSCCRSSYFPSNLGNILYRLVRMQTPVVIGAIILLQCILCD